VSRLRLSLRLAVRDLRRRATETVLLFVALAVASTTLTIGLVLHGQTAAPYAETRLRTNGPDVVSVLFPPPDGTVTAASRATLAEVADRPEVVIRSRPFPMTWTSIAARGLTGVAELQGRDATSAVDRPEVVSGRWLPSHGVVVERAFALAMGLSVGDRVRLDGHEVAVVGIAVSAALPPYPQLCTIGCILDRAGWEAAEPGLVWTSRSRVRALATSREPVTLFQYLQLRDPAAAPAFTARLSDDGPPDGRPQLDPWQDIADRQTEQLANERAAVVFGSTLLVLLALATLVVLVGGRMGDEVRRVGTLKAVGATPGFVVRLLLVSYLAVGAVAALLGLVAGRLLTPRLITLSAGLLGHTGTTSLSLTQAVVVVCSVLAIVLLAAVVPAWRAARMSTVRALGDTGRKPRRRALVVGLTRRLPAPALLGFRLSVRRPRRAALTALSIAVAVCGTVVVLYAQASLHAERGNVGGPTDPQNAQLHTVMTALTVLLTVMATVNLLFVTRANAVDARGVLAVVRALGVSPAEAAAAIGLAQLVPVVVGMIAGGAGGGLLVHGLSSSHPTTPPWSQLAGLAVATVIAAVALTAVPARLEARRPIAATLREAG
jgi:putative ABC transport system permease protein